MFYNNVINNLKDRRERILSGKVNCIPCPFKRFKEVWGGIERKKYYIVTAAQKVGKTMLTDYLFLYSPLIYAFNNPDKIRVKIFYFSLEMSKEEKYQQLISHLLYIRSNGNTRVSPTSLRSTSDDNPLDESILQEIESGRYDEFLKFFEDRVEIISDIGNPTGIYKTMENYALNHGKVHKKDLDIVDPVTKEVTKQKVFSYYEPNDEDEYVFCVVDHVSLITPERGASLHESISKLSSEYMVKIRNNYSHIPVVVQQQAIAGESDQNFKDNRLKPTVANLGDNKMTSRDVNAMFGLYAPIRHGIEDVGGYNINKWKDNIRFLELMISRDGGAGSVASLFFDGAVNYFEEMPLPGDVLSLSELFKKSALYRNKGVTLLLTIIKKNNKNGKTSRHFRSIRSRKDNLDNNKHGRNIVCKRGWLCRLIDGVIHWYESKKSHNH